MKLNKFTVVLAVLLISIMAIGAVSAESVDDSGFVAVEDGDIQESVEVADVADDLGTADTADETVEDAGSAVLGEGENSYDLDDDTYSTYFNEDGTATEALSADGDYTLNIGTLNNKDIKIASGSHINIFGKEGAGFINNGTITIGAGDGMAGSIVISGLTFTNTNKDGIAVNQFSSDITIDNNNFDLTYDSSYFNSPMAIVTYGYVDDVKITNNNIKMVSAAGWNYGIDLNNWLPDWSQGEGSAEHFYVANNEINMTSTSGFGMVEAFYIDSVANSVFENNTIYTYTVEGVTNYAIAVADSCGWNVLAHLFDDEYVGGYSPYNITIKDNKINMESADMAYGITIISWNNADEWYDTIVKDMVVSNNNVTINSQKGAIGIGVQTSDVEITENNINIEANSDEPVTSSPDPVFGNESYAILVDNLHDDWGFYYNTTVANNIITTNVPAIVIERMKGNGRLGPEPIVVEGNTFTYTGAVDYTIDDEHYSLFFNEDGTPTNLLNPEGEYTLFIDTLNNKDIKIPTGQNIYIFNKEGAGFINNGTITIGNGADKIESVQVSGLTFTNFNKDAIVVNQFSEFIGIAQNSIDLTYDSTYGALDYASPMAIVTYGYVNEVTIVGNNITMNSAAGYTYGIDLSHYLPTWSQGLYNAEHFYIADNVLNITSTSSFGMVEAFYIDSVANSVIESNTIITTTGPGIPNYAIAVADSCGYNAMAAMFDDEYDKGLSPFNITISKNNIIMDSGDMAYGITVISWYDYDIEFEEVVKDMVISENDVTIVSGTGAVGIGVQSSDVEIIDNTVTVTAHPDATVAANPDPVFGNESYAIFIDNFREGMGYYHNTTVTGNTITSNVVPVKVLKTEEDDDRVAPLVVENNEETTSILIDDSTYATYFNADGTIKDDAPISANDILVLGDLTNKKLVIDTPLTITAAPNKKLVNSTIKVIAGADGTVIDGLTIEYTGLKYGAITLEEVNNVEITNNKIIVPSTTQTAYGIAINDGENGCNNISINNNFINITGSKYVYGIDIWQDYSRENKHNNIMIFENEFFVTGTGGKMTEAIFVSNCNDVTIDGNNINAGCDGPAYGIGTNWLFGAVITNNHITVGSDKMAYGITATTAGSDLIVRANDIDVVGVGAVGIGINNQTGATIEDNTIAIDGGDYTSITVSDSLGTANAGILIGEGNTNVEMSGNDVTEVSDVRLDTVIEVSDLTVTAAPSGEGKLQITLKTVSGMLLANQTVKVVFNSQMYELTTDANGVAVLSFPLNKSGTYNTEVFYLGDDNYRGTDASAKVTINKVKTALTASGKTFLATATTKKLTATLKDANGKAIAKKKVTFTVNGKTYTATTNAKGVATVKLALKAAKTYTVKIKFAGDSVYAASTKSVKVKLNKEKTKITAPKKTFKRTAKTKKVVITLKNSKNKAVASKKITLTVNKKKYTVKTNKKGQATFKVKLTKKGTFKYTVKFAGDTQYKAVTKKTGKIVIK